jgi:DNA-binding CsgD family transcriptional regulator
MLPAAMDLLAAATEQIGCASFPEALADLLQFGGGCENMMVAAFFGREQPRLVYSNLSDRDAQTTIAPYFDDAYRGDPWFELLQDGVEDGVFYLSDYTTRDFQRSRYYREYYCHTRLRDECAVFVKPNDEASLIVSLGLRTDHRIRAEHLDFLRLLLPCIRSLCRRHWARLAAAPERRLAAPDRLGSLSRRERQICEQVLQGRTSKEIARTLELSPETVKVYRKRMNRKLEVSSSTELLLSMVRDSATA